MNRATGIVLVTNIIVGWIAGSLFAGSALALTALTLALGLAVALWVMRTWGRADFVFALVGVGIGVLVGVLVPQLRLTGDPTLMALALLFMCYKA